MKITQVIVVVVLGLCVEASAADKPDIKVVHGVIEVFPGKPTEGIIARYQIPGKQIWVSAVRKDGKTRHVHVYTRAGGRKAKKKTVIKLVYPFGTDSGDWNVKTTREGDVVSARIVWNGSLLGDLRDINEGAEDADRARKQLGVTGATAKDLPVLYFSGDSISLGYWPYLEAELWKEVDVYYQRELIKDIPQARHQRGHHYGLAHGAYAGLQRAYKSKKFKPDYIMVNCGLWMTRTHQNKVDEYGQWVQKFATLAKSHGAQLIWVTTTPTRASGNPVIEKFNAIAAKVAKENSVPVIDLNACVKALISKHGEDKTYDGSRVHFANDTKKKQAVFMANRIREITGVKGSGTPPHDAAGDQRDAEPDPVGHR